MRGYKDWVPPCCVLADDNCKEQNAAEHLGPRERSCEGCERGFGSAFCCTQAAYLGADPVKHLSTEVSLSSEGLCTSLKEVLVCLRLRIHVSLLDQGLRV